MKSFLSRPCGNSLEFYLLGQDRNSPKWGHLYSPVHHHLMYFLPVFTVIVRSHFRVQLLKGDSCHIHPTPHSHCEKNKTLSQISTLMQIIPTPVGTIQWHQTLVEFSSPLEVGICSNTELQPAIEILNTFI